MVISSPSIYIFCRHYSPLGLANINTDAREYSGPPREVYGAKDFVILRKFSIVLLTSIADDWLLSRMRSEWAIIDHIWIEWLNLETEIWPKLLRLGGKFSNFPADILRERSPQAATYLYPDLA